MDHILKHACIEIGIAPSNRKSLENSKILSVEDLCNNEGSLINGECCRLDKIRVESLLIFIRWLKQNPNADIIKDFNQNVFDEFQHRGADIDEYIRKGLGSSNSEARRENIRALSDHLDPCLNEVINLAEKKVMASPFLKESCGNFDYGDFLAKTIRHFHHLIQYPQTNCQEKEVVVVGRTQAGKTSIKAVVQSLCGVLNIPLIVLTKGVGESIDLHAKLVKFTKDTNMNPESIVVATSRKDGCGKNEKDRIINNAFKNGGTLVIADTEAQIKKACKALEQYRKIKPEGKFILAIDEADAMFRTTGKIQKFEQALLTLRQMNPSMTMYVSATPVPFMLKLASKKDDTSNEVNIDFFCLEPGPDYVGIDDLKPLEDHNGEPIFLHQNELNLKSEWEGIPYTNKKVMALYNDALSDPTNLKGILVLDCSCPRVYADKNIFDKASAVQDYYGERGKDIIAITITGSGIQVKFPKMEWERETWRKSLIGSVLQEIDERSDFGLKMPVFIFGFSKVRRGISFRSNKRVPTHMVMSLGRGHHISTVIQTLGRVTFNGKSILEENGIKHSKILTTRSDYKIGSFIQNYINEVAQREQNGESYADAATGSNKKLPDSANFLRQSFRAIGPEKGLRNEYRNAVHFEEPPRELSAHEKVLKNEFWEQRDAQALFRALGRLEKAHTSIHLDDILDDLRDTNEFILKKTKVKHLLRLFCDKSIIEKKNDAAGDSRNIKNGSRRVSTAGNHWYHVNVHLPPFVNEAFGTIPETVEVDMGTAGSSHDSCTGSSDISSQIDEGFSRIVSQGTTGTASIQLSSDDSDDSLDMVGGHLSINAVTQDTTRNNSFDSREGGLRLQNGKLADDRSIEEEPEIVLRGDYASVTRKGTVEIENKRRMNYAVEDETAEDFGAAGHQIMFENMRWKKYKQIKRSSRLSGDSPTVFPLEEEMIFRSPQNTRKRALPVNMIREESKVVSLTNIEDIPEVYEDDTSVTGTCLLEIDKKRRIYYAANDETPKKIAERFGVDVQQILSDNKRRKKYKTITKSSKLRVNSPIVLPLEKTAKRCLEGKRKRASSEKMFRGKSKITSFTNIENIPEVDVADTSVTGTYIVETDMKRRIYYAAEDETPKEIAELFSVDIKQILSDNERRKNYEYIAESSPLLPNSPIVLPLH